MANVPGGPPLQAASTTKPSLRSYTRRIIRAKRAYATLSDKLPKDEIKIPGTHPTAGRAGIDAEIWKTYVSEASDYDKNLIASWNEDLDVLLIFAGLFSAVLTAFIIESCKDLQEDYQKTSADLLRILINQSSNRIVPPFEVAPSAIRVNVLWFSSLACSLISALGAMLGKQWVRHYTNHLFGGGAHLLRARQHQAALLAAKQWRMSGVIMTIPVLMHLSLFLFFVGLSIFLSGDNVIIVRTILVISIMSVLLYAVITILPSVYQHCPFGTPFSRFLPPFYSTSKEHQESNQHSASDLDAKCLTWLMTYTTSTRIAHSAAMAVSGLACTPSQQDILYTGGGVNVLTKALASCTVEENGSLTIRRESLDTASLLLFGAQSLLNLSGPHLTQNDDHKKLSRLLKQFDSNRFLDIRSNFDAADSAAAMWCILAHRSINLRNTNDSTELVSRLRQIPISFEIPALHRVYKEVLTPCMHLVLSTQNDPVLCSWAAERMFNFWEFEGRPSLGKPGAQILLKALMGALQTVDEITGHYHIDHIISFGGVEPIIQALLSSKGNTNAQGRVAKILDRVLSTDQGTDAISSAVGLLIQVLPSLEGNADVQMTVANILDKISSRHRGIGDISSAGFGPLIQALAPLDSPVQARIARTLVKISSSDHGSNAIISGAGVGLVIQALSSLKGNTDAQGSVANILDRISCIDHGVDAISSAVGLLIQVLPSLEGNTDVQMVVAKILDQISSRRRGIDDVSGAGFGPLIRALAPLDSSVQARIAITLVKISSSDHGINAIISGAGVEPLIQALTSLSSPRARHGISETLAQISSSDCGIDAIISGTCVGPLMQAFTSSSFDTITGDYLARTLARISSSERGVNAISSEGVGPLIQTLRETSDPNFECEILKTLAQISSSACGVNAIISSADIKPLVQILNSPRINSKSRSQSHAVITLRLAQSYVVTTLARMSSRSHGIDTIISNEGVEPLSRALASSSYSNDVRSDVAKALARISSSNRGVSAIISSAGVKPLIQALESQQYSNVWDCVAETLAQISSSNQGIDAIISGGGVRPLIQAFTSVEYSNASRNHVAETLAQISSSNQGIDAIVFSQGAEPLIQALISEQWFAHGSVTRILANISSSESGIDVILSCAEPLIQALQSHEHDIQTKSIILLCRIATAVGRGGRVLYSRNWQYDIVPGLS